MDKVVINFKNRSELIEQVVRFFIEKKLRDSRENKDLRLLNRHAKRLNREAEDALSYQLDNAIRIALALD